MVFATRSTRLTNRIPSNSGSPTAPIFIKCFSASGEPYLEAHGSKNIDDIVQSHYEDTRIQSIIARYEAGETNVLNKLQGFYADLTAAASNLMEAENAVLKVSSFYESMPKDVKSKFSTLNQFIKAIGTDELKNMIIPKPDDASDGKKDGVSDVGEE